MTRAWRRSSAIRVSRAGIGRGRMWRTGRRLAAVEHALGREPRVALGIEGELLLVDPAPLRLATQARGRPARSAAPAGTMAFDVSEALIETATPVVRSAAEGYDALGALRDEVRAAGATLLGAGI